MSKKNKPKEVLCKLTDQYCKYASAQSNRPVPKRIHWCHGNCPFDISMPVSMMRRKERTILGGKVTIPSKVGIERG